MLSVQASSGLWGFQTSLGTGVMFWCLLASRSLPLWMAWHWQSLTSGGCFFLGRGRRVDEETRCPHLVTAIQGLPRYDIRTRPASLHVVSLISGPCNENGLLEVHLILLLTLTWRQEGLLFPCWPEQGDIEGMVWVITF